VVTIYYLVLAENRGTQWVSQWTLRDQDCTHHIVGQEVRLPPFDPHDRPLIASWVQYDPKRDVEEVDVGAVWVDEQGPEPMPHLLASRLHGARWHLLRPAAEIAPPPVGA